ncbi:MAG: hypothetical protein M3O71_10705 [Bacteroidota bacterium]|nr:hypothetical protein [Bacteroidota bacterium]
MNYVTGPNQKTTAIIFFTIYSVIWAGTFALLYTMHQAALRYDGSGWNDGDLISYLPVLVFLLSVVYLFILIIKSFRSANKKLYRWITALASIPVLIVLIFITQGF